MRCSPRPVVLVAIDDQRAIREVGGVLGVAVLASIFAHSGGYATPEIFNDGLVPAIWVGAAVVAAGAAIALLIPRSGGRRRRLRSSRGSS